MQEVLQNGQNNSCRDLQQKSNLQLQLEEQQLQQLQRSVTSPQFILGSTLQSHFQQSKSDNDFNLRYRSKSTVQDSNILQLTNGQQVQDFKVTIGILMKYVNFTKRWRSRFVVLEENQLTYYGGKPQIIQEVIKEVLQKYDSPDITFIGTKYRQMFQDCLNSYRFERDEWINSINLQKDTLTMKPLLDSANQARNRLIADIINRLQDDGVDQTKLQELNNQIQELINENQSLRNLYGLLQLQSRKKLNDISAYGKDEDRFFDCQEDSDDDYALDGGTSSVNSSLVLKEANLLQRDSLQGQTINENSYNQDILSTQTSNPSTPYKQSRTSPQCNFKQPNNQQNNNALPSAQQQQLQSNYFLRNTNQPNSTIQNTQITNNNSRRNYLRKSHSQSVGQNKVQNVNLLKQNTLDDVVLQNNKIQAQQSLSWYDNRLSAQQHPHLANILAKFEQRMDWLQKEPSNNRRKTLPQTYQQETPPSLWSLLMEVMRQGPADLTRVCLPVYFNEPLSSLQKLSEDLEYSELLDLAMLQPKNSIERLGYVTLFALSFYSSTQDRTCKPFNPLLGETFEFVCPEKGFRYLAEKVVHHPTTMAAYAEGRGWKYQCDGYIQSSFQITYIDLVPLGSIQVQFYDGQTFRWNKVKSQVRNLYYSNLNIVHVGEMIVQDLTNQRKAKINFQSKTDENKDIYGIVYDEAAKQEIQGIKIIGKWNSKLIFIYRTQQEQISQIQWQINQPPDLSTRYKMTQYSMILNEINDNLRDRIAPTDSRLRPDQRLLEDGKFDEANNEKRRLEKKQRAARALCDKGESMEPRWFQRNNNQILGQDLLYQYKGGYWEDRARGAYENTRDIFGS